MKKVAFITGITGMVGSHLADFLLENTDWEIVGLIRWRSPLHNINSLIENINNMNRVRLVYGDLNDGISIDTAIKDARPDYVFHLAAESRIQPCVENPVMAVNTNTVGTAMVLQCSRESGVKRVMYSSTSSAYGLANTPPLKETMVEDCLNPYSVSKVAGEKLCKMYTDLFGLETISFRYFNVYGPRQPLRGQYAPVIGLFLRQWHDGQPLTVVGDGGQRRDFTHVNDIVESNGVAYKIVKRGSNHLLVEDQQGNKFSKWPQDLEMSSKEFSEIENLAFETQIVVKRNQPNINHGFLIYTKLFNYISNHPNDDFLTILDIGTARGFSAIVAARTLDKKNLNGNIISLDVIPHSKKIFWKSILDGESGISRKEILSSYSESKKAHCNQAPMPT